MEERLSLGDLIKEYKDKKLEIENQSYIYNRREENREYTYYNLGENKDFIQYKQLKCIAEFTNYSVDILDKPGLLDYQPLLDCVYYTDRFKRKILKIIGANINLNLKPRLIIR